jgi:hypothetical protein
METDTMFQELREVSDEELSAIERLVQAATVGPWISYVVGRDPYALSNCIELGLCNELGSFKCIDLIGGTVADQDFIAAAREFLPRLVLEVRALRARLDPACASINNANSANSAH